MQFKTWQEFFEKPFVRIEPFGPDGKEPTYVYLEELYQHFKERIMDEVVVGFKAGRMGVPLKDKEE